MSTNGAYGFYKNGISKITYNHADSYFNGLGKDIIEFIREISIEEMNNIFDKIKMVNLYDTPTDKQIKECKPWLNLNVHGKSEKDWYCLLRCCQGDLFSYVNGLEYMIDNVDFISNSRCCEYGYVINLDTTELEIYIGYNDKKEDNNRYKLDNYDNNMGYYNCVLLESYPLEYIQHANMKDVIVNIQNKIDKYMERL